MPALVNSSVGSSCGTTLLDGTKVWPCFLTKKSMNCWRISLAVNMQLAPIELTTETQRTQKRDKEKRKPGNERWPYPPISIPDLPFSFLSLFSLSVSLSIPPFHLPPPTP